MAGVAVSRAIAAAEQERELRLMGLMAGGAVAFGEGLMRVLLQWNIVAGGAEAFDVVGLEEEFRIGRMRLMAACAAHLDGLVLM